MRMTVKQAVALYDAGLYVPLKPVVTVISKDVESTAVEVVPVAIQHNAEIIQLFGKDTVDPITAELRELFADMDSQPVLVDDEDAAGFENVELKSKFLLAFAAIANRIPFSENYSERYVKVSDMYAAASQDDTILDIVIGTTHGNVVLRGKDVDGVYEVRTQQAPAGVVMMLGNLLMTTSDRKVGNPLTAEQFDEIYHNVCGYAAKIKCSQK